MRGLGTYAGRLLESGENSEAAFIAVFTTLLLALAACSGGSAASAPADTEQRATAAAPATASSTALNPAVPQTSV